MKTKRRAVEEELVLVKEGDVDVDGGRRRRLSLQAREGDDLMFDSLKSKTNEGDEYCSLSFYLIFLISGASALIPK